MYLVQNVDQVVWFCKRSVNHAVSCLVDNFGFSERVLVLF